MEFIESTKFRIWFQLCEGKIFLRNIIEIKIDPLLVPSLSLMKENAVTTETDKNVSSLSRYKI